LRRALPADAGQKAVWAVEEAAQLFVGADADTHDVRKLADLPRTRRGSRTTGHELADRALVEIKDRRRETRRHQP
jgi:hypothetical protein